MGTTLWQMAVQHMGLAPRLQTPPAIFSQREQKFGAPHWRAAAWREKLVHDPLDGEPEHAAREPPHVCVPAE